MINKTELLETADGSHTLRHGVLGELYHSDRGAVGESMHVFIGNGFDLVAESGLAEINVFEVGFGSGLNAWLTLKRAEHLGVKTNYHTVELYPIDGDTAAKLNFTIDPLFMEMHEARWGEEYELTEHFAITKHQGDLLEFDFKPYQGKFNLIYFDAFAPDSQPDLWSEKLFMKIGTAMQTSGVLVTYTAKGSVKEALRTAGFTVERLEGALGKRHMVRAIK